MHLGTFEKQVEYIEHMEKELFFRQMIAIGLFSDEMKKNGVFLFVESSTKSRKIGLFFESEKYKSKHEIDNNMVSFVANWQHFGLKVDYLNKYAFIINTMFNFDEKMYFDNLKDKNSNKKEYIASDSFEWINLICKGLDKIELYSYFMSEILDYNLNQKEQKTKQIGKV